MKIVPVYLVENWQKKITAPKLKILLKYDGFLLNLLFLEEWANSFKKGICEILPSYFFFFFFF
jgi:hypothetical protein